MVHMGTVNYHVFRYLIEKISDESILWCEIVLSCRLLEVELALNGSIVLTCWDGVYCMHS